MIEVVEPMGSEMYVYFSTKPGSNPYVARISDSVEPKPGSAVKLAFEMSKAHYFDKTTEATL